MPIVAASATTPGTQTMALVIRALALDTVQAAGEQRMMSKELIGDWHAFVLSGGLPRSGTRR